MKYKHVTPTSKNNLYYTVQVQPSNQLLFIYSEMPILPGHPEITEQKAAKQ